MTHYAESRSHWGHLLKLYLTGKTQELYQYEVPVESCDDYDPVKSFMLNTLGDTRSHAARKWWYLSCQHGESHLRFFKRLNRINIRRLSDLDSKADIISFISLPRFFNSLSLAETPKMEAAEYATEFLQSRNCFKTKQR